MSRRDDFTCCESHRIDLTFNLPTHLSCHLATLHFRLTHSLTSSIPSVSHLHLCHLPDIAAYIKPPFAVNMERQRDRSDGTTLSEAMERALTFVEMSPANAEALVESPKEVLQRTFSTRSVISTTSSFATRMQAASTPRPLSATVPYRVIGLGSCGSVFEIPGTEFALKKGPDAMAISNDFILTNRAHAAVDACKGILEQYFSPLTIPRTPACWDFYPPTSDYWTQNLIRFPLGHNTRASMFRVDRILPLPQASREALIKLFFEDDEAAQEAARKDPENKDCLVRIYLGERESEDSQGDCYDDLRNFPLRLNMMEELGLDTNQLAKEMALGLAILHWSARLDAMDTEFVVGSAATWEKQRPTLVTNAALPITQDIRSVNFHRRSTHLWMLDYDKAHSIALTPEDVDRYLVPACRGNDPYFPDPLIDKELWSAFADTYCEASEIVLRASIKAGEDAEQAMKLPKMFVDGVVASAKRAAEWDAEQSVVFG